MRMLAVSLLLPLLLASAAIADDPSRSPASPPAAAPPKAPEPSESMRRLMDQPADNVKSALEHELRSAEDRARDGVEKTEQILRAAKVARGMRAADLRAGDGYFAQVLVQAVHRFGRVWTNNDPASVDEATAAAYLQRLHIPSNADIGSFSNPTEKPLSAWANQLDLVFSRNVYADAVARGIDRQGMHANVFQQMKPGARYIVVDARAAGGQHAEAAAKLCRVSEELVRKETEAAGFRFVSSAGDLRDFGDDASKSACGAEKGLRPTDRFLLVFEKPAS
jgi:predicted methyltransferase